MKIPFPKRLRFSIGNLPIGIGIVALTLFLLGYRLLSLVPYGPKENPHAAGFATVDEIRLNALYLPFKAIGIAVLKLTENDDWTRLAPAAIGLTAAVTLYLMLRKWFTRRVSILTSIMFITSSIFLHQSRLTNTDVMYLLTIPALLLISMWFLSKQHDKKLPLAAILLGLVLYIPGTWLFVVGGLIFFRRYTIKTIGQLSNKLKALCSFLFLVTVAPLVYSFTQAQSQIITWLGYNADQTLSFTEVGRHFLEIPKQLLVSGIDNPALWLDHTPILDIFSIAMAVLGIYAFYAGYYATREKLVYGTGILAILLIGLGNVAHISLLVPLVYITIANGIAYMLQSWFTVFPRNPVARNAGVVIICLAVGFSCFYQLQRYFVAWPKAEATINALTTDQ